MVCDCPPSPRPSCLQTTLERVYDRKNTVDMETQPFYTWIRDTYAWHVVLQVRAYACAPARARAHLRARGDVFGSRPRWSSQAPPPPLPSPFLLSLTRCHGALAARRWGLQAALLYALGGMGALVWGGALRLVWVYHITWFVNSAAHVWGSQSYNTGDLSRNNWWVSILAFGEGW
jgi:hypothetical protein